MLNSFLKYILIFDTNLIKEDGFEIHQQFDTITLNK